MLGKKGVLFLQKTTPNLHGAEVAAGAHGGADGAGAPTSAPAASVEALENGIAAGDRCIDSGGGAECSADAVDAVVAAGGTFEDAVKASAMTATKASILSGADAETAAAASAAAAAAAATKFPDAVLSDYMTAAAAGAAAAASSILGGGNVVETAKAASDAAVATTSSEDGEMASCSRRQHSAARSRACFVAPWVLLLAG